MTGSTSALAAALGAFLLAAAGEPPLPVIVALVAIMAYCASAFSKRILSSPTRPALPADVAYEAGLRDELTAGYCDIRAWHASRAAPLRPWSRD
jgi:hypothetical protein